MSTDSVTVETPDTPSLDTQAIGKTWDCLGRGHIDMVESFYARFFERFPQYRKLFPDQLDHHMKKMVDTMAMVARLADNNPIIESRMLHVGKQHRDYKLSREDMQNFKSVFLEVLAEKVGSRWSEGCQEAWDKAFDEVVIPLVMRGMAHS